MRSTPGASSLFFSPDGRKLGFGREEIVTVPIVGGSPESQVGVATNAHGGAVMDEQGAIWFVDSYLSGVKRLDPDGTVTEIHEPAAGRIVYDNPRPLPGGRFVLASSYLEGRFDTLAIDLESGAETVLMAGSFAPQYLDSGYLLAAQDNTLVARAFDPRTLEVGPSETVLRGLATVWAASAASYWVSGSGDLLSVSGEAESERWLVRLVPGEPPIRLHDEPISVSEVRLSPEGSRLAIASVAQDLFLFDQERGALRERLTFTDDSDWNVCWSPDGRTLAYSAIRDGAWGIAVREVGSADERILVQRDSPMWPSAWLLDGTGVFFDLNTPETKADLWLVTLDPNEEIRSVVRSPATEAAASLSSDGARLAFISSLPAPSSAPTRSSPPGAGGMGEVYRAHDPKLERDIAINSIGTLPSSHRVPLHDAAGFTKRSTSCSTSDDEPSKVTSGRR